MRTSPAGVRLIKQFEGCKLTGYLCPAGIPTIGYGHTSAAGPPEVEVGEEITEDYAEQILRSDLRTFENGVSDIVTKDLNQGQFDALVSFAFNLGLGALQKSTLLRRVNEGRFDAVPAEFMKWTKATVRGQLVELPGLVRRRRAEAALWRSIDDNEDFDTEESRATPVPAPPHKTMATSKEGNGAIVAGLGSVAGLGTAASQVADQVSQASDAAKAVTRLIDSPNFWVLLLCLAGSAAAVGVWLWRRRRLQEEGA